MFDQAPTRTPWYRSRTALLGSLAVLMLAAAALYLFFRSGSDTNTEAHYAALEQHRAQQQQSAPPAQAPETPAPAEQLTPSPTEQQPAVVTTSEPAPSPGATPLAAATPNGAASPSPAPQVSSNRARRNDSTNFRGSGRDGRYNEAKVKTDFGAGGLPLVWRQPVGGGYASFVVADGAAYTIEQRRAQEVVAAYDMETGRELWTHGWNAQFRESTGDGPRATPTWDGGRLYALGGTGELRCLDAKTGKPVWSKNILSDNGASNLRWGMAASPLIVDDKVIVQPGGTSGKSVVAYNKTTGASLWKAMNDEASYTSPMLVTLAGRRQILAVTARRVVGLAPEDGSVLWDYPWSNSAGINISQPIIAAPNRFFISAGYGKGASLVEVSAAGDNKFAARAVWENNSMKNKFNSSVLYEGHVYGLDEGIMTCVDVATGERKWKGGRYGYGQVVLAGGNLIVTTEEGEVVFVKPMPAQHTEIARFSALEGKTWNNPAIADGRLLVRNATQMACYKLTD